MADRWVQTRDPCPLPRARAALVALPDGVLVVGGLTRARGPSPPPVRYDAVSDSWEVLPFPRTVRMLDHTATRLPSGDVLVVGACGHGARGSVLLWRAAERRWDVPAQPWRPRHRHAAALLPDGRALIAGGAHRETAISDVEIYDPGADAWSQGPPLEDRRMFARAAVAGDAIWVAGPAASGENAAEVLRDGAWSAWRSGPVGAPGTWADRPPGPRPLRSWHGGGDHHLLGVIGVDAQRVELLVAARNDPTLARWTVLVGGPGPLRWSELLRPVDPIDGADLVRLANGRMLLVQEDSHRVQLQAGWWRAGPPLPVPLLGVRVQALPDGGALVMGEPRDPAAPTGWRLEGSRPCATRVP